MLGWEETMTKFELMISDIITDLDIGEDFSREDLLAEETYKKIRNRTDLYERDIDNYIDKLCKSELNRKSLIRLSQTLSEMSILVSRSCSNLLQEIEYAERFQEKFKNN